MKINNVPQYASNYRYIIARRVDTELWFYGAYNDRNKANEVASEVGGITFDMEDEEE